MGKINPVRAFLREVKRLCDTEADLCDGKWDAEKKTSTQWHADGNRYWPFGISHDTLPEDCFKREDGLWQQNDKINTHDKEGGYTLVFIWRTHISGRGRTNHSEFYEKSEREKVLYETDKLEFVWKWEKVIFPTECVWSYRMGPTFFEVRDKETGYVHIQTRYKAELIREYNAMFPQTVKTNTL
jgi:hypothetical protein